MLTKAKDMLEEGSLNEKELEYQILQMLKVPGPA